MRTYAFEFSLYIFCSVNTCHDLCKPCAAQLIIKGRGVLGHCTPPLSSSPGNQAANAANDEGNILAGRARRRAVRAADRWHAVPEQPVLQPGRALRHRQGVLRRGLPEWRVLPQQEVRPLSRWRDLRRQPVLQPVRVLRLRRRVLRRGLPERGRAARTGPAADRPAVGPAPTTCAAA